jgi:hypothetical protein
MRSSANMSIDCSVSMSIENEKRENEKRENEKRKK